MDETRKPQQSKIDEVTALTSSLTAAKSAVFVNYAGMTVKLQQDLKKRLKEVGATMSVAKNTLLRIAAQKANFPEESYSDTIFTGQTALVISNEDAVAPIQILGKFVTESETTKLKGAVVDGQFYDETGLMKLSKLPSREVLYGQVVGSMASPMYGLVSTLQASSQKLVWILESYRASKS